MWRCAQSPTLHVLARFWSERDTRASPRSLEKACTAAVWTKIECTISQVSCTGDSHCPSQSAHRLGLARSCRERRIDEGGKTAHGKLTGKKDIGEMLLFSCEVLYRLREKPVGGIVAPRSCKTRILFVVHQVPNYSAKRLYNHHSVFKIQKRMRAVQ